MITHLTRKTHVLVVAHHVNVNYYDEHRRASDIGTHVGPIQAVLLEGT